MNNEEIPQSNNISDPSNILISILNTLDLQDNLTNTRRLPRRLIYNNNMMDYLNELQNTTTFHTQPPNQIILEASEEINNFENEDETNDYRDMPPLINVNNPYNEPEHNADDDNNEEQNEDENEEQNEEQK